MALQERNTPVQLLWRRFLLLVLSGLVIFSAFGVWNIYKKERASALLRQEAESQLSDLESQQTELTRQVQTLESQRGMEAAVRQQYAMAKQGEGMVVIVEEQPAATTAASSSIGTWFKNLLSRL